MDKATLRPWKVSNRYGIEGANGERVSLSRFTLSSGEKCDANDSLVLEAVNAYDKLKRDNEALLEALKKALPLARRNCWLAYVWNDHNFEAAHKEARSECARLGITSFDSANEHLADAEEAIKKVEVGR